MDGQGFGAAPVEGRSPQELAFRVGTGFRWVALVSGIGAFAGALFVMTRIGWGSPVQVVVAPALAFIVVFNVVFCLLTVGAGVTLTSEGVIVHGRVRRNRFVPWAKVDAIQPVYASVSWRKVAIRTVDGARFRPTKPAKGLVPWAPLWSERTDEAFDEKVARMQLWHQTYGRPPARA